MREREGDDMNRRKITKYISGALAVVAIVLLIMVRPITAYADDITPVTNEVAVSVYEEDTARAAAPTQEQKHQPWWMLFIILAAVGAALEYNTSHDTEE